MKFCLSPCFSKSTVWIIVLRSLSFSHNYVWFFCMKIRMEISSLSILNTMWRPKFLFLSIYQNFGEWSTSLMICMKWNMIHRMPISSKDDVLRIKIYSTLKFYLTPFMTGMMVEAPGTANDPPSQKSFWTSTMMSAFSVLPSILMFYINYQGFYFLYRVYTILEGICSKTLMCKKSKKRRRIKRWRSSEDLQIWEY